MCKLAFLLLVYLISLSTCAPVDLWVPQDSWDGTYSCIYLGYESSPVSMTVTSYDVNTQQVTMQLNVGTIFGEYVYTSIGTANGNNLQLTYSQTISKPKGLVYSLDFTGEVSTDGNTYSGTVEFMGCNTFTLQRKRSFVIQSCGMTISTSGTYFVPKSIVVAQQSYSTPCITITADYVAINTTNAKIDAGNCNNCTGILVMGQFSYIYDLEIVNFAVGINVTSNYVVVGGVTITGTRTLYSTIGIANTGSTAFYANITISNLVSNTNTYGMYVNAVGNNNIYAIQISNLSSPNTTAGIYMTGSNNINVTWCIITQISGFYAYGIYLQDNSILLTGGHIVDTITTSQPNATAVGYYCDGNSVFIFILCEANTIVANSTGGQASGYIILGTNQYTEFLYTSNVVGDYAYGFQTGYLENFGVTTVRGTSQAYGINTLSFDASINLGTIRYVSANKAYGIYVPSNSGVSAVLNWIRNVNISVVQGFTSHSESYGIFVGEISKQIEISNTSVLLVDSQFNVFIMEPNANSDAQCYLNKATQVCYPYTLVPNCCPNCVQVPDMDQCSWCSNSTCASGYQCVSNETGPQCVDINECQEYDICGSGFECQNMNGSYKCLANGTCPIKCDVGYNCTITYGSFTCTDVNECLTPNICLPSYTCINTIGSYTCKEIDECANVTCGTGYQCVDGIGEYTCEDINECLDPKKCYAPNKNFTCVNKDGSFECADVNECAGPASMCPLYYYCNNTYGSYECEVSPPSLAWFDYIQSDSSPYYSNFTWKFTKQLYDIQFYIFSAVTPNSKDFVLTTDTTITYPLSVGTKYSFYILAVDTHNYTSVASSPIVIKNLLSGSVCSSSTPCLNNGQCGSDGVCWCVGEWSGPYCSAMTSNMTVKCEKTFPRAVLNDTSVATYFNITATAIYEMTADNQIVNGTLMRLTPDDVAFNFTFQKEEPIFWSYEGTLNNDAEVYIEMLQYTIAADLSFAGINYTMPPNTLKLSINISEWPFADPSNQLAVIFNISYLGTRDDSPYYDNKDAMNWLNLHIEDTLMYANFLDNAIIDGITDTIDFSWNNDGTVTAKIHSFSEYVFIDPNFAVLVSSDGDTNDITGNNKIDKKTAILIGAIVGGLFVILVILITFRKPILSQVQIWMSANERKATLGSDDSVDL